MLPHSALLPCLDSEPPSSPLLSPQKLIRLCALPGSNTEKEEVQFLFVVCSRVKQDLHTLRFILEVTVASLCDAFFVITSAGTRYRKCHLYKSLTVLVILSPCMSLVGICL